MAIKGKETWSSAANNNSSRLRTEENKITFEYFAPEAKQVVLAGSFNGWSTTETTLKKDRSGRWRVSLDLRPGRYEYRYLVDGKWQNDQNNHNCVRNPFGSQNSVIEVPSNRTM